MTEACESKRPRSHGRDFYRKILDSLLEGCQIIGRDWRYLYVNDAAAGQFRRPKEQLLGRTLKEACPGIEETPLFAVIRHCMEARVPQQIENLFSFSDGTEGWFDLRIDPTPEGVFILSLDITERKRSEEEQRVLIEVLERINAAETWESLLRTLLGRLKEWSRCEAVGIRIKDDPDFPYFETSGFPEDFVRAENNLCVYRKDGEVERDAEGNPVVECMCGNILCGRFDPSKTFFTTDGCFWSNCTTDLLATTTDSDRQARTRNRCNGEGYESVALIPLRSGKETFGLLQFNDHQKNRFSPERIALYRRIADHIANFIAKKRDEDKIRHLNAVLRGIRNVNQLIVREKDRHALIRQACDLLVETRGYHSVVVGLTDCSGEQVVDHAGAGRKLDTLRTMLEKGTLPDCAIKALSDRKIQVRRNHEHSCLKCPGIADANHNQDTLAIGLEHEGRPYGFMMVTLPRDMGDNLEEQDLLREVAGDLAFALCSMEVTSERDTSATALVHTREQLRLAQKLEAVGQLAGGVAHDFNNLLMAQIGYCDLMKAGLKDKDPLAEDLAQIRACADRAASLTGQLLAFSRKQTLQPEVLDLNAVVANIDKMLRRLIGEDIDFSLALEDGLGHVKADPGQIEQVIMNLVVNARDAMPQGGKLTIETASVTFDEEYARTHVETTAGPYVMLAITDTGCGMSEATKERLFEPFYTTKEKGKGSGLGLATVYGIVKQSGGNIWAYSELGKGTTFKIYLPHVEAEITPCVARETKATAGKGELILMVEDEPILRDLFTRMIKGLGYQVRTAANGGEALLAAEEEGLKPDLLITDVVMPGMGGKVLVERLSRLQPGLKVLFTSGYTDNAIVHHGILDPRTPFLQKPFTVGTLASKIRELLDAS